MRFVRALSDQERARLLAALKEWNDPSEVRRARAVRCALLRASNKTSSG